MNAVDAAGDLTVVLVNYRSLPDIEARLRSPALSGQHVIVVDNDDQPDDVADLCEKYGARALLLDQNVGFAGAVNRAVATVTNPSTPWLLLNPDVQLEREQLRTLRRALSEGDDGVAPLLQRADGKLQIGPGGGPLTLSGVVAYFLFGSHLIPSWRGVFLTRRQSRRASSVAWLCMACLLIAPDAFVRFGPIPETEIVYAEDLAWGTAATTAGARFRLISEVLVRHEQGASGAGKDWIGAFTRLCRARLGRVRGTVASWAVLVGLGVRRAVGRQVT